MSNVIYLYNHIIDVLFTEFIVTSIIKNMIILYNKDENIYESIIEFTNSTIMRKSFTQSDVELYNYQYVDKLKMLKPFIDILKFDIPCLSVNEIKLEIDHSTMYLTLKTPNLTIHIIKFEMYGVPYFDGIKPYYDMRYSINDGEKKLIKTDQCEVGDDINDIIAYYGIAI
jgi:hypothetical protein